MSETNTTGSSGITKTTKLAVPAQTEADLLARKLHFEASTIETIDKSVINYMIDLNLFADTNEGWKKVPVIWGTAERAYQVKHNKEIRDAQGMLKLPIISVKRNSLVKDMPSKGVFQGTSPEVDKLQGGALAVGRVVYQEKSSKFASADALKLHKQSYYPRPNPKTVYRTVVAPMPVNVTVTYEITVRTEYQQQMNNLILPFVTIPGTINYITLTEGEHRFEGFIQGDFQNNDNLSSFAGEERRFETKIQLKVIGYLVGEENNREKPHYAIKENAVEVKIPRERISLSEVPEHEYGAYYGLEGVPKNRLDGAPGTGTSKSPPWAPFFFSNVPAVGAGYEVASSSTGGSEGPGTGDYVTSENFAVYLAQNMVIRELLKGTEDAAPNPANVLNVGTAVVRAGTESVYLNGAQLTYGVDNDYTMNGQQITLNFDLIDDDVVTVTYIKQ